MNEIEIFSQAELDALPTDYDGRIIIKFGAPYQRAIINRKFKYTVVAYKGSYVEAYEESYVAAYEGSYVEAHDGSYVEAYKGSCVAAYNGSYVEAHNGNSVLAYKGSYIAAYGGSHIAAYYGSSVAAYGTSYVAAYGGSHVEAYEGSSVAAYEGSCVEAYSNTQIYDKSESHNIKISGNSRIVYEPRTVTEYLDYYGIKHGNNTRLYKAVHKRKGKYYSDYDSEFEYVIGETKAVNTLNTDTSEDCGEGIHMAYLGWCLEYGKDWGDLAILEVEAEVEGIILPEDNPGKVRAKSVKVLREIPLEECGVFGKILAKKRRNA